MILYPVYESVLSHFAVISLITFSDAHPGGLDANGGHYDRKTGEYHYHRKPAAKPIAKEKRTRSARRGRLTIKVADITGLVKGMPAIHPAA